MASDFLQTTGAPSNKGLERTRPAANGLTGPCRSIQCSTGTEESEAVRPDLEALG